MSNRQQTVQKTLCMVAVSAMALVSSEAYAANALVVNNPTGSEPALAVRIANNVATRLTAKGLTPTISSSVPGVLSSFQQIWDLRFQNSSPITVGERGQYVNFLNGGGGMFVMGENSSFMTRNDSVIALVQDAGGGSLVFQTPSNLQDILPAAQSPNVITTINYQAAGGVTGPGTGQCLTRDSSNRCAAVAWGVGALANAPTGSLTVVFDVNFMDTLPGEQNQQEFFANLVNFVTVAAGGGGGSDFAALGDTPYQQAVGGAFNSLFGNTSGELSSIMTNIAGMSSRSEQQRALEVSASSFPEIPVDNAFTGIQANLSDVVRWLNGQAFVSGPTQNAAAETSVKLASVFSNNAVLSDSTSVNFARLASAAAPMPTWSNGYGLSAFLNLGYVGGGHDNTLNQVGYIYNGFAGTGGLAYDLTKDIKVGGGIGITNITSRLDDSRGNATTGTYNGLAFAHYADGSGLYADMTANVGYVDYDYDRNIVVGAFSATANGETNGWQAGTGIGGGYNFNLDNLSATAFMRNIVVGPFGQLQYQYAHLAGFTESGAGTASLKVAAQGAHSLRLKFGGRVEGEIQSTVGPFVPSLSVAYEREFLNGARSVGTSFVGGPATSFDTPVDSARKNFAVVGAGLSKDIGGGFSAGLSYDGRFNLSDRQHAVTLRGKLSF
jgi:uncharacterized protein YhjY with autotransporter beta-barrel domain